MKLSIITALLLLTACNSRRENRIVFHLNGAFHRHFVIQRVAFNEETETTLDSGLASSNKDSFIYHLPPSEASVYLIRFQGRSFQLPFIYDSSGLAIFYNYTTGKYHFENSPASEEWQRFLQGQTSLGSREQYTRNFNFADTVSNPALFLLAYGLVDYGRDYNGLQQFIQRAGARFPTHHGVQTLVKNTIDFISAFRTPLKLGDPLPSLSLPDSSGHDTRIGSIANKYVLVDFWSTWCDQCRLFSDAKKKAWHDADTSRFSIISIAIDAEKDAWRNVIRYEQYPCPQLIDEKMWSGPAARTYKVDSLPFNFLVDPRGIIVAKSISADSLFRVVKTISGRSKE
jgi:thiol-disulfide isomerase/thioredoxin